MRLQRLRLLRFGHFVDRDVELDHSPGGLRFVLGPNEAGKSTLRDALRMALFGPGGQSVGGRRAAELAVEAEFAEGGAVLRRTGLGAPRRADGEPFEQDEWSRLIPVSPELFDRLFCLDHDELRRSAQSLLQTDGGLGRIVFGASLGGGRIDEITDHLTKEVEVRFKGGGSKQLLPKALAALAETDQELLDKTRSASEWLREKGEVDRLQAQVDECSRQVDALRREEGRLARVARTAAPRAELGQLRMDLTATEAAGPVVTGGEVAGLLDALARHRDALRCLEGLGVEVEQLEAQLAAMPCDRRLLDQSAEVERLIESLGQYGDHLRVVQNHRLRTATSVELMQPALLRAAKLDLEPLLGMAASLPDAEAELARRDAEVASLVVRLQIAVDRAEVTRLEVPGAAVVERRRREVAQSDAERTQLETSLADARRRIGEEQDKLAAVSGAVAVPMPEEIRAARERRDERWSAVRGWFVDGVEHASLDRAGLAGELDGALVESDRLADFVLTDTERAATVRAARDAIAAQQHRQAECERLLSELDTAAVAAAAAWRAAWADVTTKVGDASEMAAWTSDYRELVEQSEALAADSAGHAERVSKVEAGRDRLAAALVANGRTVDPEAGFDALYAEVRELVDRYDEQVAAAEAASRASAAIAAVDAQIGNLAALLPSGKPTSGEDAIRALREERQVQQQHHDAREKLLESIGERERRKEEQARERDAAAAELARFGSACGVAVDDLGELHERSQRVADLAARIEQVSRRIVESGDGLALHELEAEASAAGDPDAVAARRRAIEDEVARLDDERKQLIAAHTLAEQHFRAVHGQSDAAELAEDKQRALSDINRLVEETGALMLAKALLDEAVDAARSGGEQELVERASAYFVQLTGGAFCGIELEAHGDEIHAFAVREGGDRLAPANLSDGTLDQLWLAWRLAGVEHHLDLVGAVPLFVDDVLVHFDDGRAGHTFEALAKLSERTQVVVFTHHRHLIEVARDCLGSERVAVTELGPRAPGGAAIVQQIAAEDARPPEPADRPSPPSGRGGSSAAAPGADIDQATAVLLAAIDGEWRGKQELLERSGIDESAWASTIKGLLGAGAVAQEGAKRGAKYRRVGSS